jgi:hypothetical protein
MHILSGCGGLKNLIQCYMEGLELYPSGQPYTTYKQVANTLTRLHRDGATDIHG